MAITKDKKQSLIKSFAKNAQDTGGCAVQTAILTERINSLADHFKKHPKDNASSRGLMAMVNNRKRLLAYLKRVDAAMYEDTIKKLNLRK
jgi:small subunit ribosomal protein S15